jgi:hypothetical protein
MLFVRDMFLSHVYESQSSSPNVTEPLLANQPVSLCSRCKEIDFLRMAAQLQSNVERADKKVYPIRFPPWTSQSGFICKAGCALCTFAREVWTTENNSLCIGFVDEMIEPGSTRRRPVQTAAALTQPRYRNGPWHAVIMGIDRPEGSQDTFAPRIVEPCFIDTLILRSWLTQCSDEHTSTCWPVKGDRIEGFRLLDCRSRCVIDAPADCHYIALSYLWGSKHEGTSQLLPLPQTIEDAVQVTLLLDYKYLCESELLRCI